MALATPAHGETVVNGGFEAGNLSGWHVSQATSLGDWFAYQGTAAPIGHHRDAPPVQAPPQGDYAAIADEADPDSLILYQDLQLEPGSKYQLSLLAYYDSYAPIAVPQPDTLSIDEAVLGPHPNQQFRIDVVKPDAPLDSLNPEAILATLFKTGPSAPTSMKPKGFSANLAPFAGQTVRLRIATAMSEEVFNAGVDAVQLVDQANGGGAQGQRLRIGKARLDARRGIVKLPVRFPASGRLTATARRGLMRKSVLRANGPERLMLRLAPTRKGRSILSRRGRLRLRLRVGWKADDSHDEVLRVPVTFKLNHS
ncbi:MAG TPA: hypothetical protein VFI17_01015 [Solirubrobacterales bacterium]|nr:hypothetical protein [Solirubrobacterales bacterium]